jgi:hypothetical protein
MLGRAGDGVAHGIGHEVVPRRRSESIPRLAITRVAYANRYSVSEALANTANEQRPMTCSDAALPVAWFSHRIRCEIANRIAVGRRVAAAGVRSFAALDAAHIAVRLTILNLRHKTTETIATTTMMMMLLCNNVPHRRHEIRATSRGNDLPRA